MSRVATTPQPAIRCSATPRLFRSNNSEIMGRHSKSKSGLPRAVPDLLAFRQAVSIQSEDALEVEAQHDRDRRSVGRDAAIQGHRRSVELAPGGLYVEVTGF